MKKISHISLAILFTATSFVSNTEPKPTLKEKVIELSTAVESKVIDWRHHIHENPELSNREFETAKMVAAHLKSLGIEVQENIAKTGVVGTLVGGKPGPTIGLRADMDGLPVPERVDLSWASKAIGEYNGAEVPVMHACGHDTHVAILMGVAEVLSQVKKDLRGTVKFVFQPAEEGAPPGEEGGAKVMVREGVLENMDVIFGLHISSGQEVNKIAYRPNGLMASANSFTVKVYGAQAHGSAPWMSIDPIVTSAQIINNAQTIISRNSNLTKEGAVLSFGKMTAGVRNNIIPEYAELVGTIRTLDVGMQKVIFDRFKTVVEKTAESNGARAELIINDGVPITYNDPDLTALMAPTFIDVAGAANVHSNINATTGAEDFSFYANEIPAMFFFLGGMPKGNDPTKAPSHHTPDFYVDDAGLLLGIKTMTRLVVDYGELKK